MRAAAPARGHVTRVLVVEDEAGLRRALAINLRARGYDGRRRRRTAPPRWPGRRAASARRGRARPRPAGHGRRRGDRGPARLEPGADHRAVGARRRARQGRSRSTPAPTTTSPSRSAWTSCSRGCAPRCAAARRAAPTCRRSRSATFTVDLAAKRAVTRRRRDGPPDADRVAPARGARPQRGQARRRTASCCRRSGARATRRRPTTCASTSPSCGASSSASRRGPRHLLTEPGIGLPLRAGGLSPRRRCYGGVVGRLVAIVRSPGPS